MERRAVRLSFVVVFWLIFLAGLLGWRDADRQREAIAAKRSNLPDTSGTSIPSPPARSRLATRSTNRSRSTAPQLRGSAPTPTAPSAGAEPPPKTTSSPQESQAIHGVLPGETLHEIAGLYGVGLATIRGANGLQSDLIRPGQRLIIPGGSPLREHRVQPGDTLWEIATRYGVEIQSITRANKGTDPGHLQIGQILRVPPTAGMVGSGGMVRIADLQGEFVWPVLAPVSSQFGPRWGRNHAGIDLAANHGDDIRAARAGRVVLAGVVSGYGNTVVLQHADGSRTLYAHCSVLRVKSGQSVSKGQVIAQVGSTGISTGPHLHFEIIVNDRPADPLLYLPKREDR